MKKIKVIGVILCITTLLFFISIILITRKSSPPDFIPRAEENAVYFLRELFNPGNNLQVRMRKFPEILNFKYFYYPPEEKIVNPSFLEILKHAKIFRTLAIFSLLQGKRQEALNLLIENYHLGKLIRGSNYEFPRYLGSAIQGETLDVFIIYILNCCDTEEDFNECRKIIKIFEGDVYEYQIRKAFIHTLSEKFQGLKDLKRAGVKHLPSYLNMITHNYTEDLRIRASLADVKFELMKMAAAARYQFLFHESFPISCKDFLFIFPDGLPNDVYGRGEMKYLYRKMEKVFLCYSAGPDKIDHCGTIEYDPSNGTTSLGDIILKIPEEKTYPFPREGLRANNANEVRKIFPHGLPMDIFACSGTTLHITDTYPVFIYSFGPDADDWERENPNGLPEVMYDPINGLNSNGDLWICVPLK